MKKNFSRSGAAAQREQGFFAPWRRCVKI